MPEDGPMISSKSRDILAKVRMIVPPMLDKFHKGQLGRVAVIGGSQDYTGAPFFSANASAKLGADMSHVICEPGAGQVIKTYSPNLMVHPLMRQLGKDYSNEGANANSGDLASDDPDAAARAIVDMLPRLHALVIGPGLGRDPAMQKTARAVLLAATRDRNMPVVLDADGLQLVNAEPDLVKGCKTVVLTPNVVEFGRLARAVGVDIGSGNGNGKEEKEKEEEENSARDCERVSAALGGVVVVQKGRVDIVSNGELGKSLVCDVTGGRKRSGGQGDTLTGCTVALLAWRKAYHDGLWDTGDGAAALLSERETLLLAAFGGAAITRECSRLAFERLGRAMQASDVGDMVPTAFLNLIGEKDPHPSKI